MAERTAPAAARLPTFDDIVRAARRLQDVAYRTPLLRADALDERVGGRVLVKAECLQRTGSFKIRGAFNRVSELKEAGSADAGVVAFSSGNHAQGVAAAARLVGIPALIVMPGDAPRLKIDNTRRLGAEIQFYDRWTEDREAIAAQVARDRGAMLVPAYDDPGVIAGQGTVGLELAAQARELGMNLDAVLVPAGGGGLMAGTALALATESPGTQIYSAEPEGFDDHARSLAAGARVTNAPEARSICDALMAPKPGRITFAINQELLTGGVVATDGDVIVAMEFAFRELKLVLEPGGAIALAALLAGRIDAKGRTIGLVLSGSNIDRESFSRLLENVR
jgi:threonine dehydratase